MTAISIEKLPRYSSTSKNDQRLSRKAVHSQPHSTATNGTIQECALSCDEFPRAPADSVVDAISWLFIPWAKLFTTTGRGALKSTTGSRQPLELNRKAMGEAYSDQAAKELETGTASRVPSNR